MPGPPIYVSRLVGLPLLDADGATVGRVADVLLGPSAASEPPRVLGFVVSVQRRRIFVGAGRIAEVDASGVRLAGGTVDLRHFRQRPGELLATSLLDRRIDGETLHDLALAPSATRARAWEVTSIALGSVGPLRRRRTHRVIGWQDATSLFDFGPIDREMARLREMHPSDQAAALRDVPLARRRQLAEGMEDQELADVLEELPETDQVVLLEGLEVERIAHVLEEMAPDDAADLLAEMPGDRRARLLAAMEPDEADPLRRLLLYAADTAGGLMTPEPLILQPTATVAEALARLRDPDLPPALAAQVFVVSPPTETPTGPYLGVVGFQQLLREPPSSEVGACLTDSPDPVGADLSEVGVAERLAAYNLLAVAVCDDAGRMLGAVSVDDVLDRTLPAGWRGRP
ncbi:MAG: Magnesium transporter [Acidimicrobiales bacterium]|jgi:flagellar motility protein MotE (MotC chaperone)|nr:Magnesium transporter [Acidimicrobiales bacterium]